MVDPLDRRLADALRRADLGPVGGPPSREALRGALRRRRARRRRLGARAVGAALVIAGGGWAAVALGGSSTRSGARGAAIPVHPPSRPGCAEVLTGGAAGGRCVGMAVPLSPPAGAAAGAATPRYALAAPAAGTALRLRMGRSVSVVLPSAPPGSTWGAPRLATAAPSREPAVQLSRAVGSRSRWGTVTVTAVHDGRSEVVATTGCRSPGSGSAGCGEVRWAVEVVVSP